jgi:hypothetical protein
MNEVDWLQAQSPTALLEYVKDTASDRKIRLFGCALYRRRWPRMRGAAGQLVELAERFADGEVKEKRRARAWARLGNYSKAIGREFDALVVASACDRWKLSEHPYCCWTGRLYWPIGPTARLLLDVMLWYAQGLVQESSRRAKKIRLAKSRLDRIRDVLRRSFQRWPHEQWFALQRGTGRILSSDFPPVAADCAPEERQQAIVVRELFGNPFRPFVLEPDWLAWNDGTVRRIAQRIYDERLFHDTPILADALEEAGCTNEDVLAHLRRPNTHARGCWALDLVLGKP